MALDSRVDHQIRACWVARVAAMGYRLERYVSPSADVPDELAIGANSMVMEGASIHPFVRIGANTVIGLDCRLGFHASIGDHCWLSGALLGESVQVGDRVTIGQNATIAPFTALATGSCIGPGTLITTPTAENEVRAASASVASRVPSFRLRRL